MKNNTMQLADKYQNVFFWSTCIVLFLPIIILPPNFQPSDWTRSILFRVILTGLICFLLFKFFYKKAGFVAIPKRGDPIFLPLLALLGLFATLIVSTVFSEDIIFSVFGSPSRGGGGLLNLLFLFLFTIFLAIFAKEKQWNKFFNVLLATGVLASLLAIVQYFNFFKNIFIAYEGGRTPSFLGNSTFLAMYLLFLGFLSVTLLVQEKNTTKKVIYGGLLALFLFTIFITGARAAYLGVLAGLIYYLLFYPRKIRALKMAAASFLLCAMGIVLILNFFPRLAEKNNILKVAANRLSITTVVEDLAGTRFATWKITWQAIQDKPLLGWGPENFYIGFEKYYDPTLPNLQNLWWDRPHNVFLEYFVNSGIFALVFYIAFWTLLLWRLYLYKKEQGEGKNAHMAHGIIAMFIGYLTSLFFNFDSFSTYLISFFFIGYSFYLLSKEKEMITILPPETSSFKKKPVLIAALIPLALFIWFWNVRPFYANESAIYAKNLSSVKKCNDAFSVMKKTNEKPGILGAYSALIYSDIVKKCANSGKEVEYSRAALEALKRGSIIQPKFTRTWLLMGAFLNVLAAKEENKDNKNKLLWEARGYFETALKLSPKRNEIVLEQEKNYLLAEDYQMMINLAERCIAIDTKEGGCYWYLGIAQIFLGDQENGKKNTELAKENGYNDPQYLQLGVAYISQKNYKDAARAYELLLKNHSENASYHATLALLYKQIGEYKAAADEAMKVFQLQPDSMATMEFIEGLLGFAPNDPSLHSSLAFIYTKIGEMEKARQEYQIVKSLYLQLVAQYPNSSTYHYNLAVVYNELKEYDSAEKEAQIALKLGVKNPKFIDQVEKLIYSVEFMEGVASARPNDPAAHSDLAFEYIRSSENDKARKEFEISKFLYLDLIAKSPNSPDYHYGLAVVYSELREYDSAEKEAYKALSSRPPAELKEKIERLLYLMPPGYWQKYLDYMDSRANQ